MDPWLYWIYMNAPVFFLLLMVLGICLPILFIWFWKKKVPKPARTLFWCAVKGYAPLLLVHDSGRADIVGIKERSAEGIVETTNGVFKILPRFAYVNEEEEEQGVENNVEANGGSNEIIRDVSGKTVQIGRFKFHLDYSHWISKRTYLLGMPTPFFVGYTGVLCLLNPDALALFEAGDLKVETSEGTWFNPHNVKNKNEEDAIQPLMLLDPRKIGSFITRYFHQSQISGVIHCAEERARIGMGAILKKFLIFILIFIVVMGVILAITYLPKLLGKG